MRQNFPQTFNHIQEFEYKDNCFWYWMEVKADSGTKRIHCKIADIALEDKAGDHDVVLGDLEAARPYLDKFWGEITFRCQMKHQGNLHEDDGTILIRTGDI